MTFKVGDRVEIDPDAFINRGSGGDSKVAAELSGGEWQVEEITDEGNLLLEGAENQGLIGYSPDRFKLVTKGTYEDDTFGLITDDLGVNEALSTYRACLHGDHWVVEAVRVSIICVAANEDEAVNIAASLITQEANV